MSISRGSGVGETSSAIGDQLVGRLAARGQDGDDAVALLARARRSARAARLMRSASATEVPPNFITTVPSREAMRPAQDTAPAAGARGARHGAGGAPAWPPRPDVSGRMADRPAAAAGPQAPPGARRPPFGASSPAASPWPQVRGGASTA